MKIFHSVVIPFALIVSQIPAISGYFKGIEGLDGIIYQGFPGYAVGILYMFIGAAIAIPVLAVLIYIIERLSK
jgi:high-affinity Fe2+/Pb2+ permease